VALECYKAQPTKHQSQQHFIETMVAIRCFGKDRTERVTPLTNILRAVLKQWLYEPRSSHSDILFPTVHGSRMSPDAVHIYWRSMKQASVQCPSLQAKRISPHVLRQSAAIELLDAGVEAP
jgi:site-specific recombinase XerD